MFLAFLQLKKPGSLYHRTEPPKCQNLDSVSFTPPTSPIPPSRIGSEDLGDTGLVFICTTYICHLQKWADT